MGKEPENKNVKQLTIGEIKEHKKKLAEIGNLSGANRSSGLTDMANELGVYYFPADGARDTHVLYHNIHTHLQSEMMYLACVSAEESSKSAEESSRIAKRACIWAAIAAIVACIGIIINYRSMLICGYVKFIQWLF